MARRGSRPHGSFLHAKLAWSLSTAGAVVVFQWDSSNAQAIARAHQTGTRPVFALYSFASRQRSLPDSARAAGCARRSALTSAGQGPRGLHYHIPTPACIPLTRFSYTGQSPILHIHNNTNQVTPNDCDHDTRSQ
jgi:hypothetical protein